MSLAKGALVDSKYRIERVLGRGGMAAVYLAEHEAVQRRVAVKVLHRGKLTDDAVERFEREAQAAGRIGSRHICQVFDLGKLPDGSPYMVMEYLKGETVGTRQRRLGRIHAREASRLIRDALAGLEHAHAAGVIHRDLKPGNLFIVEEEHGEIVKLIDFGISKFSMMKGVTNTSVVLGTPTYMAPEQTRGVKHVDARADLFSIGATLYKAVAGRSPYAATEFNSVVIAISRGQVVPLDEAAPDVDRAFIALVTKAMSFEPEVRFQTAREFAMALAAWEDQSSHASAGGVSRTVTDVDAAARASRTTGAMRSESQAGLGRPQAPTPLAATMTEPFDLVPESGLPTEEWQPVRSPPAHLEGRPIPTSTAQPFDPTPPSVPELLREVSGAPRPMQASRALLLGALAGTIAALVVGAIVVAAVLWGSAPRAPSSPPTLSD